MGWWRYRVRVGLLVLLAWASSAFPQAAHLINSDEVMVGWRNYCASVVGTGSYACSYTPAITVYTTGGRYTFQADVANTGAATLALNGMGAKALKVRAGGAKIDLPPNTICAGQDVEVVYDGTDMQMVSQPCSVSLVNDSVTFAKMQNITTDRVLGRDTAGTGDPEELTLGGGLEFTGTGGVQRSALTGDCTASAGNNATTCTKLNGGTFAGTSGNLVSFGAANVPADSGVVAANVLTSATAVVRSIYIPAGSMDVEGACAPVATAVLLTNGPKLPTISCTDANTDGIQFDWVMPDGWNAGTITIELAAFSIANNTGEIFSMNFSGQCVRDTDSVAAFAITSGATATSGSNVATTITWGAAANREQHATSAALTLAGTCAAGAHVYLHGLVNATTTTTVPMTDAKILGAKVEYTRSGND